MKHPITLSIVLILSGYVFLDSYGAMLLGRNSGSDETEFRRKRTWQEVLELMKEYPTPDTPLGYSNIENSKRLVWQAQLEAPDEWEGGDRVPASLNTIKFLANYYPAIEGHISDIDGKISLAKMAQAINSAPIPRWKVPFCSTQRNSNRPRSSQNSSAPTP